MATGPAYGTLRQALRSAAWGGFTDGQLLEQFVARRDEEAFAVLVRRHGPMVLGVCRRVLRSEPDAEDAFQATFLVLARRAACVVPRQAVGNWLYGVACRTAREARRLGQRRRARERSVAQVPEPAGPAGRVSDELALLDGELSRLPAKYREAIVLCDLEGRSRREAARQLGLPEGTLSSRLAAGRKLLGDRLRRRLVAGAWALSAAAAEGASGPLFLKTVQSALASKTGPAASPAVTAISERVVKEMLLSKCKVVVAAALAVGLVVLSVGSLPTGERVSAQEPVRESAAQAAWKALPRPADRDEDFIRRVSLDLRGRLPTLTEVYFFVQSKEPKKRDKVIDLMIVEREAEKKKEGPAPKEPEDRGPQQRPPDSAEKTYESLVKEYARILADEGRNFGLAQQGLLNNLKEFLKRYPEASDGPAALWQLGAVSELMGNEQEAKAWYERLARREAGTLSAKAKGALRRLNLGDEPFELRGKPIGSNRTVDLADFRGEPVLVYYWASWSPNAARDFDRLRVWVAHTKPNVPAQIVTVNLDEDAKAAQKLLQETAVPGLHLHSPGGFDSPLAVQYGLVALPTMFLVDSAGKARRITDINQVTEKAR